MNETSDPITPALSPLQSMNTQARAAQTDPRDELFQDKGPPTEQSYAAPAAPTLSPPVPDDPETKQNYQENTARTESIRPLGM